MSGIGEVPARAPALPRHTQGVAPMPLNLNLNLGSFMRRTGSAPSPFDAINGPRLAGPQGSHPLHSVMAEELVRSADGGRRRRDRPGPPGHESGRGSPARSA